MCINIYLSFYFLSFFLNAKETSFTIKSKQDFQFPHPAFLSPLFAAYTKNKPFVQTNRKQTRLQIMSSQDNTSYFSRFSEASSQYKLLGLLAIFVPFLIYLGTWQHPIPDKAGASVSVKPSDGFIQAAWVVNVLGLVLVGLYSAIGTQISTENQSDTGLKTSVFIVLASILAYSILCFAWTAEYENSDESCLLKRQESLKNSAHMLAFASFAALMVLVFFIRVIHYRTRKDAVLVNILLIFPVLLVSYTLFATYLNVTESQEHHIEY